MNGIYLKLLLAEIESRISGRYIDEIRIKQRLLQLAIGKQALFVSLYPEMLAMYLSERVKAGFDKLEKFSQPVVLSRIKCIEQNGFSPVLRLILEKNSTQLILSLYREAPNLVLKTKKFEKKLYSRYIEKEPKRSIIDVTEQELQSVYEKQPLKFQEFLLHEFEGLDKNLSVELTPARISYLKKALLSGEVKARIVSTNPFQMSLFASKFLKEYSSFNHLFEDGFKQFIAIKDGESDAARKTARIKSIKQQLLRLQKKMLNRNEIESYRIKGELILINLAKIKKGSRRIAAKNPYKNKDEEIIISLDPVMTPQENAQYYFSEYKKIKRGVPKIKNKMSRLEEEIEKIQDPSFVIPALLKTQREQIKKAEPYRIFKLASGSVVYTGRNARSNNELTFSFARPNDYFFHIRNYEGAHVILKAKIPRGQRPNKRDLQDAAAIAAYFSKAKKQKNIPVSYTQRKYLKKNKKGKPGSVILMREDVVFVDPGLPVERDV
ncbi:MAG: NFACT RNA binding domain-containing protein [bacterium]